MDGFLLGCWRHCAARREIVKQIVVLRLFRLRLNDWRHVHLSLSRRIRRNPCVTSRIEATFWTYPGADGGRPWGWSVLCVQARTWRKLRGCVALCTLVPGMRHQTWCCARQAIGRGTGEALRHLLKKVETAVITTSASALHFDHAGELCPALLLGIGRQPCPRPWCTSAGGRVGPTLP